MRQWMRMAARHWVSPVLFTRTGSGDGLAVEQLLTGPGNIREFNLALLILGPVLAGAWIAFLGGRITAALCAGQRSASWISRSCSTSIYCVSRPCPATRVC